MFPEGSDFVLVVCWFVNFFLFLVIFVIFFGHVR